MPVSLGNGGAFYNFRTLANRKAKAEDKYKKPEFVRLLRLLSRGSCPQTQSFSPTPLFQNLQNSFLKSLERQNLLHLFHNTLFRFVETVEWAKAFQPTPLKEPFVKVSLHTARVT
jgi:hypothetical protein